MRFLARLFKKKETQSPAAAASMGMDWQALDAPLLAEIHGQQKLMLVQGNQAELASDGQHQLMPQQWERLLWIRPFAFDFRLMHELQRGGESLRLQAHYQGQVEDLQRWSQHLREVYTQQPDSLPLQLEAWWEALFKAYSQGIPLEDLQHYLGEVEAFLRLHMRQYVQGLGLQLQHFSLQAVKESAPESAWAPRPPLLETETPEAAAPETTATPRAGDEVKRFYYYQRLDQRLGPFSVAELNAKIQAQEISAQTMVWEPGMGTWKSIAELNLLRR